MTSGDRSLHWQVKLDANDAIATSVLHTDRLWNGYSLCDLEPPLRQYTQVAVTQQNDTLPSAALLVLRHPSFVSIVPHGDPDGIAAILETLPDRPTSPFILMRDEHQGIFAGYYTFDRVLERMQRMAATAATFQPPTDPLPAVERLGADDFASLQQLYGLYPANAFNADQLQHGVFYGVRDGASLLAAGGTHALAPRAGIAAVGNIFTRPDKRGHGYGLAITAAIVRDLLRGPFRDIVLNVAVANTTARRLYERLGFRMHCSYWEGAARLIDGGDSSVPE